MEDTQEYDYVVVRRRAAGCALAARLADARPHHSIALLEAGPAKAGLLSDMPIGLAALVSRKSARNYGYQTVPQPGLGGRRGWQPRGRGVGGSSLINAMVYIRGHPGDYDDWERAGATGWGWADVLPYFKACEHNERGGSDLHGSDGPLNVADLRDPNPLSHAFIEAGRQAGYKATADFNGPEPEGFGLYQVYQKDGRRFNAARAFLGERTRLNLHVIANTQAERIVFEGRRAAGLVIRHGGALQTLRVRGELVLSGGAFGTPALLMASGVGPGAHLAERGVAVLHDAAEVGGNLQDHLDYTLVREVPDRNLVGISPGWLRQMVPEWRRWTQHGRGALTSNLAEAGAFLRTDPALDRPDIQLHFVIAMADDHGRKRRMARGLSCHVCVLRPQSRGTVRLPERGGQPVIDPGYLSAPADLATLARGVATAQRVMDAPAMASYGGRDLYPDTGAGLEALIRKRADTIYHPVGTCRMGSDPTAVLDPALRVQGVDGLRVADASVMPTLVGGNTQAASAMIGMRAADLIAQANR